MAQYYLAIDGEQTGPFEVEELVAKGMKADSLVWTAGMADWLPASEVAEVAFFLPKEEPKEEVTTFGTPEGQAPVPPVQQGPPPVSPQYPGQPGQPVFRPQPAFPQGKKNARMVTGIYALTLGFAGIQYFYLGKSSAGILTILLCIITGGLWTILTMIQGALILKMSDEEFIYKYTDPYRSFPLF